MFVYLSVCLFVTRARKCESERGGEGERERGEKKQSKETKCARDVCRKCELSKWR